MLKTAIIIPVKTFSKAKTRLDLSDNIKSTLCEMMLDELLQTVSVAPPISEVIVVTKDATAIKLAEKFHATVILDDKEQGVNQAISLADEYIEENKISATIVLPQDIPFIKTQDIDFLLKVQIPPDFVTIVPSRKFDGTNALLRMPHDIMKTYYDQDSYRAHTDTARKYTRNSSILFVKRIMMDIDDIDDLKYALKQNEKPQLCEKIKSLIDQDLS